MKSSRIGVATLGLLNWATTVRSANISTVVGLVLPWASPLPAGEGGTGVGHNPSRLTSLAKRWSPFGDGVSPLPVPTLLMVNSGWLGGGGIHCYVTES